MKILGKTGCEELATVYIAENGEGKLIEFVESVQPPLPREDKWVLIVSSLYGCPVGCRFCDAGYYYCGKLSKEDILAQIDYLVERRFPQRSIPVKKFKVQFARMGEPALNEAVLAALEELGERYDAPGLLPTLSTIAPKGRDSFFRRLKEIKRQHYRGRFQLQFSLHSTDESVRDWLMPVRKWSLSQIGEYGEDFMEAGDRKITLNFALAENAPVDPDTLLKHFPVAKFLIKMTPVNPTFQAKINGISTVFHDENSHHNIVDDLREAGYEVIVSIGELRENKIGSNCGQHIMNYLKSGVRLDDSYTFKFQRV